MSKSGMICDCIADCKWLCKRPITDPHGLTKVANLVCLTQSQLFDVYSKSTGRLLQIWNLSWSSVTLCWISARRPWYVKRRTELPSKNITHSNCWSIPLLTIWITSLCLKSPCLSSDWSTITTSYPRLTNKLTNLSFEFYMKPTCRFFGLPIQFRSSFWLPTIASL